MRQGELDELSNLCLEHDLAIVSDEVFEPYRWQQDPQMVRCAATSSSALTFSLGGLSKAACLPQLKLGWIVIGGPDGLVAEATRRLEMIADTFLSVSTPVQLAARALLAAAEPVREQLRSRIVRNLASVRGSIQAGDPFDLLEVEAGWYATLRVPRVMSDEQWACELVQGQDILVHPGSFFGFASGGHLVLSLIGEPGVFDEGVGRLLAAIRAQSGA